MCLISVFRTVDYSSTPEIWSDCADSSSFDLTLSYPTSFGYCQAEQTCSDLGQINLALPESLGLNDLI